ncbi:hypothetical protein [Ekhidna sp. To15]|uniref:hypothetical protein n=1 Tax=Ekhidna sp. To15 TaxID=3395267 RepID=UPI003F526AE2
MKIRSLTFAILVCTIGIVLGQCPSYSTSSTQKGTCRESYGNIKLQGEGAITLTVDGSLTINGDLNVVGETVIVNGELTILGSLNAGKGSSVIISDGGLINVVSMVSGLGSSVTVEKGGSLAISQNAGSGLYAAFAVDFGASVYVGGSFVSGGIGISDIDGDMMVNGDFTNAGGGVIEGNGVIMVGGDYIDNGDDSNYSGLYNGEFLDVKFVDFAGEMKANDVTLNWQTAVEFNSHGFEVERSSDGEHFETIGWMPSHQSSMNAHEYSFTDNNPIKGLSYYRLRKVEFDGLFAYSSIIRIDEKGISSTLASYPNPAIGKIRKLNELDEFQLHDSDGTLLLAKKNILRAEAEKLISQQIEQSPLGTYTLSARIGESTDKIRLVKK